MRICDVVIRPSKRMHSTMLLPVACPAVQHFPTLSHKRYGTEKNVSFDFVYKFFPKYLSL